MKKICKRILAVLLILCSVLSYTVPVANAATEKVTYDFNQLGYYTNIPSVDNKSNPLLSLLQGYHLASGTVKTPMTQRYLNGDQNWTYEAASEGLCGSTSENEHLPAASGTRMLSQYNGLRIAMGKSQDDWIAFRIKSPGAGTYTMTLDFYSYAGSPTMAFYILEAEGEASIDHDTVLARQEFIHAAMDPDNRIGRVDQDAGINGSINNTAYIGSHTFEADKEYILVAETYEVAPVAEWYACFSSVTLTKNGKEGTELTGEPEVGSLLVEDNLVPAADGGTMGALWEMENGHDYFFLPIEGGKMAIYDLDEWKLVTTVTSGLYYPTSATVTSDGKVVIGGDGKKLFIFDTKTMTGRMTPDFRTTATLNGEGHNSGVQAGSDGYIYFGTLYGGHMVQYDMEKRTYRDLGDMVCKEIQQMANPKITDDKVEDKGGVETVVYHDGHAYGWAASNSYDVMVKYDLEQDRVVGAIDVTAQLNSVSTLPNMSILGDRYLIAGGSGNSGMVLIDLENFTLVTYKKATASGLISASSTAENLWEKGMSGHASEVIDGKQYFESSSVGMFCYDTATGKLTRAGNGGYGFRTGGRTLVTLDRDGDGVEEPYLFSYGGSPINPRLFNFQKFSKINTSGLIQTSYEGAGGSDINIGDSYNDVLYIGAWNNWNCVAYDTVAEAIKSRYVTGGQTDSQVSFLDEDGAFHLVSGNYSACVVYEIDPLNKTGYDGDTDTNILMPLISKMKSYEQKRIHTVAGGDGYVFAGTIPGSYITGGGVGVYNRATGTEDFIRFKQTSVKGEKVVPNSELWDLSVQCVEYYDGRLFGTTTRSGGSGSTAEANTSARIFVMDYENMTIEATLDLRDHLTLVDANKDGKEDPITYVSGISVDEQGRFWGLCSDVLFCFTYDKATKTFAVQEVLNLDHSEYQTSGSATTKNRKVVFDSENSQLFTSFYKNGMQQVVLKDWNASVGEIKVSSNTQILTGSPYTYALGANNNLYYASGANLYMKPVNVTASDWTRARAIDEQINELVEMMKDPDVSVTEKAAQVAAVKERYNALSLRDKALVQETRSMKEIEAQILRLQVAEIYDTVTAEDYEILSEMNVSYMEMNDQQKRYIRNAALLEDAFFRATMFKQDEALNQLQKDIYALEVNTLSDAQGVLDARLAYDALWEEQKNAVNIGKLLLAEEKLDALRQESEEAADSGTCGENMQWVLDGKGILTISGTGSMENYSAGGAPWYKNYIFIRELVLDSGIAGIGEYAFSGLANLQVVYYKGTERAKENILIGSNNDSLMTTQWHYGYEEISLGSQIVRYCSCCDQYYLPVSARSVFADISNTGWQFKPAIYAFQKGLMAGKGTDAYGRVKFDPNSPITREEFVQVLYNAEGKPAVTIGNRFPDVKEAWYKNAVLWANEMNIASGMGNGNFGVGKNITRQDLAMMLYKYAAMKGCSLEAEDGMIDQFADGNVVSGYAKTAMNWAVKNGVLSGKGAAGADISTFRLDPIGTATRAECAAMLKNFMTAFRETLFGCSHRVMEKTEAKAADCTENGNIDYWYCAGCDKYFADSAATTELTLADTVLEAPGHSWNDATCTEPQTCTACGATEGSALGHSLSMLETVPPTCSEQGYDLYKCDNCDYTEKQNYVPVTDHNYVTMDLPTAATKAVEADPLGPNGFNYAKYTVSEYCDYDTQICTVCNHIDLAATCFRYTPLEAAQMMLQWVNDLRAEVYGTHAYDLILDDFCQSAAEIRAVQLTTDYSHSGSMTPGECIVNEFGLYNQFLAWKNSPLHYEIMIRRDNVYFGYGYAAAGYNEFNAAQGYGCMTVG